MLFVWPICYGSMMQWIDDGLVLSAQKYGENSVILHSFSREHGRYAGMVRGGTSKRLRGLLQPGNEIGLNWRGRLSEHLGNFTIEAKSAIGASLFADPLGLSASSAALALLMKILPEREPHPALFEATILLIKSLSGDIAIWGPLYVRWELGVLAEMGYGLDLGECAATGSKTDLVYVSPKSGRAVSKSAGWAYRDRMLKLPAFLQNTQGDPKAAAPLKDQVLDGMQLSGYFIHKFLLAHYTEEALPARERLITSLKKDHAL
ncbi:MAG: DNA repair protein RecO [Sneathiella sp.]|nr:DNA repair protein RecO [Sneathiella sp.]